MARAAVKVVVVCLLASVAAGERAHAEDAQLHCSDVEGATAIEMGRSLDDAARVAAHFEKVHVEFEKFLDQPKFKNDKPLADSMNVEEAAKFGNLQEQIKAGTLSSLVESRRVRDIRVISRARVLADRLSRDGFELPAEGTEDRTLIEILVGLRQIAPKEARKDELRMLDRAQRCDLEVALATEAVRTLNEIDAEEVAQAAAEAERLSAAYGSPIDVSKMPAAERDRFLGSTGPTLDRAIRKRDLADDLLNLAALEHASKKLYESNQKDLYAAPGDMDKLGSTWSAWIQDGVVKASEEKFGRVISYINERIPSDLVKEFPADK